jgi:ribosomal-protein-alanine N-acetyltransferase
VIGIAGFWLMMREAHITTIAVRKHMRRQGIGEQLLISIIEKSIELNAQIVTLEVRISNEYAQLLYQKYGFYKTGTRQRYYTDNGEDAFIMSTDTITTAEFQSDFKKLKHEYEQKWGHIIEQGGSLWVK